MKHLAPLICIDRHRLSIDGEGVTTLVAFHGCPLHCKHCLNPQCLEADGIWQEMDTEQLIKNVEMDNLYFLATGGGICFGGGEPLLHSSFIKDFCKQCPDGWQFTMETSLNAPHHHLEDVTPFIDAFIIDIKDMNPDIYQAYTGKSNRQVIDNLVWLSTHAKCKDKIIIRLPLIPQFNTTEDRNHSRRFLKDLGFENFDEFEYVINIPTKANTRQFEVNDFQMLRGDVDFDDFDDKSK